MKSCKKSLRLDAATIGFLLILGMGIAFPYARMEFSSEAWNNDYNYMSLARMFREQPWTWNALQYCGTPFSYIYPPLFLVMIAAIPASIGHAYHLLSALGYALVPVSLYILAVQLFRSRLVAAFGAVVYLLLASPVYVLPLWRNLARGFHYAPWSFVALMGYSEAVHTFALAIGLASLAAAWRNRWTLSAALAGMVFLLNWPGIIGLLLGLAALAVAKTHELGWFQAGAHCFATAGIGYGLTAFWMTPGVFSTTTVLDHVLLRPQDQAVPWNQTTWMVVVAGCTLLALALYKRTPMAVSFTLASISLFGTVVVTFSAAGNALLPLPHRYVLELNIVLVLAIAWLATGGKGWSVAVFAGTALIGGWVARDFLIHPWAPQPARAAIERMPTFQIADWLQRNAASDRVFTSGELDGALNALSTVAQVGGIRQGISNPLILAAQRQVSYNCAEPSQAVRLNELWLRALDARFIVVHDATSSEHFHWFVQPETFSNYPIAWTNHAGDTIYRVPAPQQHSAVVVDLVKLRQIPQMQSTSDLSFLESYVSWAQGVRPAQLRWTRPDDAEIDAVVGENQAVLVKVNYDRGWRSNANAVRADPIGFLLIEPKSVNASLRLNFGAPWDMWLGRAITLVTIGLLLFRVRPYLIATLAVAPAAVAYFYLMASLPGQVGIAERSFRMTSPPIINPGGLVYAPDGRRRIAIYGMSLGKPDDVVKVWIGKNEGAVLYRGENQVNVEIPAETPAGAGLTVEVNGCRGNSFLLEH
jgi:hypothetical protein